jgi:hypothetical protein
VRVALLFIDGVGIGVADPSRNPLARAPFLLSQFQDGSGTAPAEGALHRLDACFGVPGRPQSASNQTAILTGLDAPRRIGRHVLGYPNAELRALLDRASIVKRLVDAGRSATFANSYPAGYLDALGLLRRASARAEVEIPKAVLRRIKPSATTCAFAAAKVPLRTLDDLRAGEGLTHDIEGVRAGERFDLPRRTPEEAAAIFWRLAHGQDFTLFEHYLADEAGHAQDLTAATHALETFDRFARQVIATRPADTCVLICSDHGNVEDLSIRSHTLNEVPLLSFGAPLPWEPRTVADVGRLALAFNGLSTEEEP